LPVDARSRALPVPVPAGAGCQSMPGASRCRCDGVDRLPALGTS